MLLQGSSELAALVAGIGYYRPDSRKQRTESPKQHSARTPIGCVSRFDTVEPVGQVCRPRCGVCVPYALVRVEATSATTFGRLDRLNC